MTLNDIRNLIKEAQTIKTSGHSFLDQRWQFEGANIDGKGPRNKDYRRQYYRFNQLLTKTYKPELVVELGIDEGDSVAHFASGNPTTQVIGVDVHKDWEYPATRCKQIETFFPNFKYMRGWTWEMVKHVKALNKPIDILFIDSWHEPDYLIRDWNDYHKLCKKGSLIMVDDFFDHRLVKVFEQFPGEKFIDRSLNSEIGFMIYDGTPFDMPYQKQDYMNG
jgi:cephalosporin hydroxylase